MSHGKQLNYIRILDDVGTLIVAVVSILYHNIGDNYMLTPEERAANAKASKARYRLNNLEKFRAYRLAHYHSSGGKERDRERRQKNPENSREACRRYYAKNRAVCNAMTTAWRQRIKEAVNAGDITALQKKLCQGTRKRAKNMGWEHTISPADIPVTGNICPATGATMQWHTGKAENDSYTLDRIDPTKGYVPGNVQVLSMLANRMKSDAPIPTLVNFARWVLKEYGGTYAPAGSTQEGQ